MRFFLSSLLSLLVIGQIHEVSTSKSHILVTGGAGYIGSHTVLLLLDEGYEVTVVDNLVNSKLESLVRVQEMSKNGQLLHFYQVDLKSRSALRSFFDNSDHFSVCIHFAGLKAVGESSEKPLEYYHSNVGGTVALLEELDRANTTNIIFSSSATVYGDAPLPITEDSPVGRGITNPYGRSKYFIEEILNDLARSPAEKKWNVVILRYFNPVGAHPSGRIGEDPNGLPNNLMPFVSQVAIGKLPHLSVFGNDYPTRDGTGVRDYIHVLDLAEGHIRALSLIESVHGKGVRTFNLGSGSGSSVLEMIGAMKKACKCDIPFHIKERREGDLPEVYASTVKAKEHLNWTATRSLDEMCKDLWAWQSNNPMGYPSRPEGSFEVEILGG